MVQIEGRESVQCPGASCSTRMALSFSRDLTRRAEEIGVTGSAVLLNTTIGVLNVWFQGPANLSGGSTGQY